MEISFHSQLSKIYNIINDIDREETGVEYCRPSEEKSKGKLNLNNRLVLLPIKQDSQIDVVNSGHYNLKLVRALNTNLIYL